MSTPVIGGKELLENELSNLIHRKPPLSSRDFSKVIIWKIAHCFPPLDIIRLSRTDSDLYRGLDVKFWKEYIAKNKYLNWEKESQPSFFSSICCCLGWLSKRTEAVLLARLTKIAFANFWYLDGKRRRNSQLIKASAKLGHPTAQNEVRASEKTMSVLKLDTTIRCLKTMDTMIRTIMIHTLIEETLFTHKLLWDILTIDTHLDNIFSLIF